MAFAGLNLTIGRATGANGSGQLPHGAIVSQNMATPGLSTIKAPVVQGSGIFYLFRVRSTADCFVSISLTPSVSGAPAWFVAANTDYDFWGSSGDFLYWTLA